MKIGRLICCVHTTTILATLVMLTGCSGVAETENKLGLMKVAFAIHFMYDENDKAPANSEELVNYMSEQANDPIVVKVIERLKKGEIVIIWNAELSDDGDTNDKYVLGYEKQTPDEGGMVLMGGGSVQTVTAEEFKKLEKIATKQ